MNHPKHQEILTSSRLRLRPFVIQDAQEVQIKAGDKDMAALTKNIPHPYPQGAAEEWIKTQPEAFANAKTITYAITKIDDPSNVIIGAVSLKINQRNNQAEIGYWLAKEEWNQGYMTEAAQRIITYGFSQWNFHKIVGTHLEQNPASGRVMEKIGFTYEGTLKEHIFKNGVYHNLVVRGVIQKDWRT